MSFFQIHSRLSYIAWACLLLSHFTMIVSAPALAITRPEFQRQNISIVTEMGAKHSFDVEVARTADEKAFGLMFKRNMPNDRGMIFIWDRPATRQFWMRNTYMSLDILFFDAEGMLLHIAPNAEPLSDTQIPSLAPAQYVVEVNAGIAAKLGITIGSKLELQ